MIDTKLITKAKGKSKVIERIDLSWREFVSSLKENTLAVPYKGEYPAQVKGSAVLVEAYCGLLLIDKLYFNQKTYLLKMPIKYYPFRIFGVYGQKGEFEHFTSDPEIGFHYLGMSQEGHAICTGDIQYINPDSLDLLKEAAGKIINSFRVINLESLGTVLLPEAYSKLKEILSNKEADSKKKLAQLLDEDLIEGIL